MPFNVRSYLEKLHGLVHSHCAFVIALLVLAVGTPVVQAQDSDNVKIESVRVGLANVARVGVWTPIQITVSSPKSLDCVVECETPDPTGSPFAVRKSVSLQAKQTSIVRLVSVPGRLITEIIIRVKSSDGIVLATRKLSSNPDLGNPDFTVKPYDVPTWLVVGEVPAIRTQPRTINRRKSAQSTIQITETNGSTSVVEAGATDILEVSLPSQPSGVVRLLVETGDSTALTVDRGALEFDSSNWSTAQKIVLTATDDHKIDGTQQTTVKVSRAGTKTAADRKIIDVAVQDDEIGVVDQIDSPQDLPNHWKQLATYDTIVLSGHFDFDERQTKALQLWTQRGGHLLCIVGSRVDEFRNSPLAPWLSKIKVTDAVRLNDVTPFETLVSSSSRIPPSRSTGCTFTSKDALPVVESVDGNLVLRTSVGVGRVTTCGVDLDKSPFSNWRAKTQLLQRLADFGFGIEVEQTKSQRFSQTGISELQSQLQTGLESDANQSGRSTLFILGLILAYLVIIGPGDYALVHRLFKSPHKTWYTFPGLVVLIATAATLTADSWNSSVVTVNQVELIDVDSTTGFVREKVWYSVFSPENRRYKISIDHAPKLFQGKSPNPLGTSGICWVGLPETSYGGMYRQKGLELGKPSYSVAADFSVIDDLPIPIRSNRILSSEAFHNATGPVIDSQFKRAGNGQLSATSTMTQHLTVPIDDWLVVYGSRVYYFDYDRAAALKLPQDAATLKPDVVWNLESNLIKSQQLNSFLTGTIAYRIQHKTGADDVAHEQTKYNPRATNLLPIIRMLSLHDHAGGQQYTSLGNDSLREFELSESLPLDRAIILGRVPTASTQININGHSQPPAKSESFVRIVIPVLDKEPTRKVLPKFE